MTRNGNFGFYATYGWDGAYKRIATGNADTYSTEKIISFVYGYGKLNNMNEDVGQFTKVVVEGTTVIVPTERIVYSNAGDSKLLAGTNYTTEVIGSKIIGNFADFEGEETIFKEINIAWDVQEKDCLRIPDMGNLTSGHKTMTKYYIAHYTKDAISEQYQFEKEFNIYPTYFNFSTTDVNNRVTAEREDDIDGYSTFNLNKWGDEVTIYQYDTSRQLSPLYLKDIPDLKRVYFEIGDENLTNATIDEDGVLKVKTDQYKLNGEEYITINIYVRASGENALYISDILDYSGNIYNKPMLTVKVYLKK